MFIYKPNYSTDILYALYGVIILLLIAFFISQPTANNDIYMQMLAIADSYNRQLFEEIKSNN